MKCSEAEKGHSGMLKVRSMAPQELLAGQWRRGCLALVMPGGADKPYCQVLNGHGNRVITGWMLGAGVGLVGGVGGGM